MKDDEACQLLTAKTIAERKKLLAQIFMSHRLRLRRMIELRMDPRLKARVGPSDVLQEAYLEAAQRVDAYLKKPGVPLFVWLRSLVGQHLQKMHRRHLGARRRDVRREIPIGGAGVPAATSAAMSLHILAKNKSPSEEAIQAEQKGQLEEGLVAMDPIDREVLALRHFEHLTSAEAALVLGIGEDAAKKRYLRALERLKHILSKMGLDAGAGGQ